MVEPGSGLERDRVLGGPGFDLYERTLATVVDRSLLAREEVVLVAYSGGPDSTCLLDVLTRIRRALEIEIVVAHVDHGLSPDSEDIAGAVARNVAAAGLDVHVARARDLEGPNLHERARDFRYAFFESIAEREGATKIATGHTLDDRVETTLARLIHGAGTSGLAGLQAADGSRIRPLVEARRSETRAYCEACGLGFVDDPANSDPRFERARIRSTILAAIEAGWGDGAVRAIARSADRLAEDSDALDGIASRLAADLVARDEGETTIALAALHALPRSLRRRILERAVGRIRDRAGGIEAVLDALDRADGGSGSSFDVASGITVTIGTEALSLRWPD